MCPRDEKEGKRRRGWEKASRIDWSGREGLQGATTILGQFQAEEVSLGGEVDLLPPPSCLEALYFCKHGVFLEYLCHHLSPSPMVVGWIDLGEFLPIHPTSNRLRVTATTTWFSSISFESPLLHNCFVDSYLWCYTFLMGPVRVYVVAAMSRINCRNIEL